MAPLNAFDQGDQRYAKARCLCKPLTRVKTVGKVIDTFDLAFDIDQCNDKSITYLIPPLTCIKGGIKVKITFAHDIFDTHFSRVKVFVKAMITFDLDFDQDQI